MNHWPKTAVTLALLAAFSVGAQTLSERAVLVDAEMSTELSKLKRRFQSDADQQELRVQEYLQANPTAKRQFQRDGSSYYLSRVDSDGSPVYINTKSTGNGQKNLASGQLIKADSLYPGGSLGVNITGTGMVAGIWDGGTVRATHELLAGQVTNMPSQAMPVDDHMTHVSGTMVGKDIAAQPSARGIAYTASSQNYDWTADKAEMTAFAANGFLLSNHSYGYANDNTTPQWKFGAYDSEALAWDTITKNAPNYLPFVAAGNEQQSNGNSGKPGYIAGYDVITGASAAKNVMTVGAVNGDKTMSTYSNFGPMDDGRLKPDLVAKGTGINSAQATSDTAYSGNGAGSSGTSYATPAAAASGLLLQQYYKSLYGSYMRASTLKALMIGTAEDLGRPGPDVQFGWGLLNVEAAATAIKKRSTNVSPANSGYTYPATRGAIIEEITVNPSLGSEMQRYFTAKGGVPIVATLCWTDDEGTEQVAADGTDPTATRAQYSFGTLLRNTSVFAQTGFWLTPTMANPTANATKATATNTPHPNTCVQVVSNETPTAGQNYTFYIRKIATSPSAARTVSLVVTGVNDTALTVTASAGANGSLVCGTPASTIATVAPNATTTCTATPNAGFQTATISGCGGTATSAGVNAYTTGAVPADCTVTASFVANLPVNGVCGTANGVAVLAAPSANLCTTGTASVVTSGASSFTWSCDGANSGTNASCAAPRQYPISTPAASNGSVTCIGPVTAGNTTTCTATPASGYVTQSISGCGGTATGLGVNTYTTGALAGACTVTATFALAFVAAPALPVATLSEWALLMLALMLGTGAWMQLRSRRSM